MARSSTKKTSTTKPSTEVADFELSTGQASAANRFASALARKQGKAAVSFGSLGLPKTLFGAAEMVGHVSDDIAADIEGLRKVLEATEGMTKTALRNQLSPTRAAKAAKRAEAKAKKAAKAPAKKTAAKKAPAKKVTQKAKATAKAKPAAKQAGTTSVNFDAVAKALANIG